MQMENHYCSALRAACTEESTHFMAFFNSAVTVLQTLVIPALGAGLGIWGTINLLEGYGNDNPGAKSREHETADGWRRGTDHDSGAPLLSGLLELNL